METLLCPPPISAFERETVGDPCANSTAEARCPEPVTENSNNKKTKKKNKKKNLIKSKEKSSLEDGSSTVPSSSSSSSHNPTRRALGVACRRRNPMVRVGPVRRSAGERELEGLALPLGMSLAAFVNMVLEKKDSADPGMLIDNLPTICSSAVRESLANVYGHKFDSFVENFERSFRSTLRTLSSIKESSTKNPETYRWSLQNQETSTSDAVSSGSGTRDIHLESNSAEDLAHSQFYSSGEFHRNSDVRSECYELSGDGNQLVALSRNLSFPVTNGMSTMERSVREQTRANDLKVVELGLRMRKLSLKDTELALNLESNNLEKSKMEMGRSKASFKVEKFKIELEETRYSELLKRCLDCLVAGLFIMIALLLYGAYVFSYQKITEATAACVPTQQERFSWWLPKQVTTVSSGLNTFKCQARVVSQMGFGLLMIIVIVCSIALRASPTKQAMPVTYILLLLGGLCGFAGKFCVDTLGGSGNLWLVLWEVLCALHFFANVWTSALFVLLNGPINVSQCTKSSGFVPYWMRRVMFYGVALVVLPVSCGLLPFAGILEWRDHFHQLLINSLTAGGD